MDHFRYHDGRLRCEEADLVEVAKRFGTPTYVYSRATLLHHYRRIEEAFRDLRPLICFSVKSCPNIHVLRVLVEAGAGLDVVSGGELHRARLAGCDPGMVVFAGVGKTSEEMADALGEPDAEVVGRRPLPAGPAEAFPSIGEPDAPIGLFNVESEQEFQALVHAAESLGKQTSAALRVNPDVDPQTHRYTTTGKAENKFGVDLRRARTFFRHYAGNPRVRLRGVHVHLGSPIATPAPFVEAIRRVLELIDELAREGVPVDVLDLGGGFAADYRTGQSLSASEYAAAIVPLLADRVRSGALRIILEPGRFISGNAGVLLTRVHYVKGTTQKKFVICDAGMHTLIRPALYEAFHFVWPCDVAPQHEPPDAADGRDHRADQLDLPGLERCDVVGPICESSDFLCQDRMLPPVARGDLLAVFTAGAYGMSMASRYNSHGLPAEVMIEGAHGRLIRRRETYWDLVEHESNVREASA